LLFIGQVFVVELALEGDGESIDRFWICLQGLLPGRVQGLDVAGMIVVKEAIVGFAKQIRNGASLLQLAIGLNCLPVVRIGLVELVTVGVDEGAQLSKIHGRVSPQELVEGRHVPDDVGRLREPSLPIPQILNRRLGLTWFLFKGVQGLRKATTAEGGGQVPKGRVRAVDLQEMRLVDARRHSVKRFLRVPLQRPTLLPCGLEIFQLIQNQRRLDAELSVVVLRPDGIHGPHKQVVFHRVRSRLYGLPAEGRCVKLKLIAQPTAQIIGHIQLLAGLPVLFKGRATGSPDNESGE